MPERVRPPVPTVPRRRPTDSRRDAVSLALILAASVGIVSGALASGVPDPERDPLAAGSPALLYDGDGGTINVNRPGSSGGAEPGVRAVPLPTGMQVVALDDARPADDLAPDLRLVEVRVTEGTHHGVVGLV